MVTIQPGVGQKRDKANDPTPRNVTTVDTLMDLVRNMFPPNLVEACISQHQTKIVMDVNATLGINTILFIIQIKTELLIEKKKSFTQPTSTLGKSFHQPNQEPISLVS